jgi:hydrogenase maturation protease
VIKNEAVRKKRLILGMGNSILSDDKAGLELAKMVHDKAEALDSGVFNYSLELCEAGGMQLIDLITGYDSLVIIDSIKTGKYKPGQLLEIDETSHTGSHRLLSGHDLSIFEAVKMGRQLGAEIPTEIKIFAVEVTNNLEFGEKMSPEVEVALAGACEEIVAVLKN